MVKIIIIPPVIVSILGCSLMTNQTQKGPNTVSNKKKRLTSDAVMYLGARVIKTKGIATQKTHIAGIINKSLPLMVRSSIKNRAISAIINLAIIAEGIKLALFLPALIITAPAASPKAQINPYILPLTSPFSNESIKISIRFLTNEVRTDALDIKVFYKKCNQVANCKIEQKTGSLVAELKKEILSKAAIYKKQNKDKKFTPYTGKAVDITK